MHAAIVSREGRSSSLFLWVILFYLSIFCAGMGWGKYSAASAFSKGEQWDGIIAWESYWIEWYSPKRGVT